MKECYVEEISQMMHKLNKVATQDSHSYACVRIFYQGLRYGNSKNLQVFPFAVAYWKIITPGPLVLRAHPYILDSGGSKDKNFIVFMDRSGNVRHVNLRGKIILSTHEGPKEGLLDPSRPFQLSHIKCSIMLSDSHRPPIR